MKNLNFFLNEMFSKIGLNSDDIIVIQSSFSKINLDFKTTPENFIEELKKSLNPNNTVVMPAYNFEDWTEKKNFSILNTASKVGLLTEVFRKSKNVKRTLHPIHSLCAYGAKADYLSKLKNENSFGLNSPFEYLLKENCIYLTIGTDLEMPFLPCHYAEKIMKVPYRKRKIFQGKYTDEKANTSLKSYSFDVRTSNNDPVFKAHKDLFDSNCFQRINIRGISICFARAIDYHQGFIKYIKTNPSFFDN